MATGKPWRQPLAIARDQAICDIAEIDTDRAPFMDDLPATVGVLLAGGLASRMGGGDKPLRKIGDVTILARAIARLQPQCQALAISANGDPTRFGEFGVPVLPDTIADHPGPLAGILAALEWTAENRPDIGHVVSAPADCPFLPVDLVARLHAARVASDAPIAVAASGGQQHHVVALWSVALRNELRTAIETESLRQVSRWIARHASASVEWPTDLVDPFFNVNTPADLVEAERLALLLGD